MVQYRIETDVSRQLVKLTFAGQWDLPALAEYRAEMAARMAEFAAAGGIPGKFRTLVNTAAQGVQPREVAEAFQAMIAGYSPDAPKTAVVVSESALHQMQLKRIGQGSNRGFFSSEEAAMAWLDE